MVFENVWSETDLVDVAAAMTKSTGVPWTVTDVKNTLKNGSPDSALYQQIQKQLVTPEEYDELAAFMSKKWGGKPWTAAEIKTLMKAKTDKKMTEMLLSQLANIRNRGATEDVPAPTPEPEMVQNASEGQFEYAARQLSKKTGESWTASMAREAFERKDKHWKLINEYLRQSVPPDEPAPPVDDPMNDYNMWSDEQYAYAAAQMSKESGHHVSAENAKRMYTTRSTGWQQVQYYLDRAPAKPSPTAPNTAPNAAPTAPTPAPTPTPTPRPPVGVKGLPDEVFAEVVDILSKRDNRPWSIQDVRDIYEGDLGYRSPDFDLIYGHVNEHFNHRKSDFTVPDDAMPEIDTSTASVQIESNDVPAPEPTPEPAQEEKQPFSLEPITVVDAEREVGKVATQLQPNTDTIIEPKHKRVKVQHEPMRRGMVIMLERWQKFNRF